MAGLVIGAWLAMALTGTRRPAVDRLERIGRVLGWVVIAQSLWKGFIYVLAWH